jgi:hypothetical protein
MVVAVGLQRRSMIVRLTFTVVGVLLMLGPPYALVFAKLTARFQPEMIAAVELASVVVGFVLLYLGLRERKSST